MKQWKRRGKRNGKSWDNVVVGKGLCHSWHATPACLPACLGKNHTVKSKWWWDDDITLQSICVRSINRLGLAMKCDAIVYLAGAGPRARAHVATVECKGLIDDVGLIYTRTNVVDQLNNGNALIVLARCWDDRKTKTKLIWLFLFIMFIARAGVRCPISSNKNSSQLRDLISMKQDKTINAYPHKSVVTKRAWLIHVHRHSAVIHNANATHSSTHPLAFSEWLASFSTRVSSRWPGHQPAAQNKWISGR